MNKIQFDKLLKPLVEIYDEIELDLIRNILLRFENYKGVEGSLEWYIDKLNDTKLLTTENKKLIKKNKKLIESVLKDIVDTGSKSSDYLDTLETYYNDGKIDVSPNDLYKGNSFNRTVKNALNDVNDITDLINSKVLESSEQNYKKIINKAYIETSSGIYTYQESIKKALIEFAKSGIDVVHYENGRTLGIEAVVRRDVITRVNKLVGDIDLQNAEELGTDLVYVDQHLGARIRTPYMEHDYEAHAEWQGKVYTTNETNDKYPNFYETTGYGEMMGLKGINCYHNFRPFFEWEKIPKRIDEEENKEEYEQLQMQRAYERKIRSIKREMQVYKQIDKEEYKRQRTRLETVNNKYNEYLNKNDLNRDYSRELVLSKTSYNQLSPKEQNEYLIKSLKHNGIRGKISFEKVIPDDINEFKVDLKHINDERNHNVTKEQAMKYIDESIVNIKVWKGRFINYYSKDGATYVDLLNKTIRTSFTKEEYTGKTKTLMEVLSKYGK